MKKKYLLIILIPIAFFLAFWLLNNNKPLYLLENNDIDKIVIHDLENSQSSVTIIAKDDIDQLVSYFNNYNLRKNKAEAIDSIMQYKVEFYKNELLIVTVELNLVDKESDWAYNIGCIFTVDEHKYYKLPDSFIDTVKNFTYSH